MVFFSKLNFLCRTTPGVDEYINPLEDCLRMRLIPTLTGRNAVCDSIRSILSLPVCLGGLGLINPIRKAATSYTDSTYILSPIVESIIARNQAPIPTLLAETFGQKSKVKSDHRVYYSSFSSTLFESLSDPSLKRCTKVHLKMLSVLDMVAPHHISRLIVHVVPPLLLIML